MKIMITTLAVGAALAASAASPVGETLPSSKLEMIHPLAENLSELQGRAILVEFFAEW